MARFAKAASHKISGQSSLNVNLSRPVLSPVLSCLVLSCPVLSMTTMFTMFTMTTMINMTNMTIMTTMTTMTTMTMATSWRLSDQMRVHSHVDYSLQRLCGPSHM